MGRINIFLLHQYILLYMLSLIEVIDSFTSTNMLLLQVKNNQSILYFRLHFAHKVLFTIFFFFFYTPVINLTLHWFQLEFARLSCMPI